MQNQNIDLLVKIRKLIRFEVSTMRQLSAMLAVEFQPSISTVELSKAIQTSRASTAELCKQLEAKGLMEDRKDIPSRRVRHEMRASYYLTEKGKKAIETIK